jgi:hypothetical protein
LTFCASAAMTTTWRNFPAVSKKSSEAPVRPGRGERRSRGQGVSLPARAATAPEWTQPNRGPANCLRSGSPLDRRPCQQNGFVLPNATLRKDCPPARRVLLSSACGDLARSAGRLAPHGEA